MRRRSLRRIRKANSANAVKKIKNTVKSVNMTDVEKSDKEESVETKTEQRITQIIISPTLQHFASAFLTKFQLRPRKNLKKPCIFFGVYKLRDLKKIREHKGMKIIIWAGSDSHYKVRPLSRSMITGVKALRNSYHISISRFIAEDLKAFKIPNIRMPLCFTDFKLFNPVTRGNCIYVYVSLISPELYGASIVKQVKDSFPKIPLVITTSKRCLPIPSITMAKYPFLKSAIYVDPKRMKNIYSKCFIGLRLTKHDGNANTVQELGLCGIKCIYNGDRGMPNALRWTTVPSVIRSIRKEIVNIGTVDTDMSERVKTYLNKRTDWLYPSFYTKK